MSSRNTNWRRNRGNKMYQIDNKMDKIEVRNLTEELRDEFEQKQKLIEQKLIQLQEQAKIDNENKNRQIRALQKSVQCTKNTLKSYGEDINANTKGINANTNSIVSITDTVIIITTDIENIKKEQNDKIQETIRKEEMETIGYPKTEIVHKIEFWLDRIRMAPNRDARIGLMRKIFQYLAEPYGKKFIQSHAKWKKTIEQKLIELRYVENIREAHTWWRTIFGTRMPIQDDNFYWMLKQ